MNNEMQLLREQVYEANMDLVKHKLVVFTWGNVSGIDRKNGWIAIKPSGVSYEELRPEDIPVIDIHGNKIDGNKKPSSDTPTHLELYRTFDTIGGIVHTHSEWATSWAQAGRSIPAYGTTHADYFYGEIPCTRLLSEQEIKDEYELNTGKLIAERFENLDEKALPGVLVHGHGPFSWGKNPGDAVHNAVVMEEVAKMAFRNEVLGNKIPIEHYLLEKHYSRKHGKDAYYGQK